MPSIEFARHHSSASERFADQLLFRTIIWLLVIFVPQMSNFRSGLEKLGPSSVAIIFVVYLIVVVLSDYISLPFVRYSLKLAKTKPISASVISSVIGLIVVTIGFFILYFIGVITINWISPVYPKVKQFNMQAVVVLVVRLFYNLFHKPEFDSSLIANMRPAFIIHLWLPLFALSTLIARLVFWIFRAVEWAQWFLKQGDAHPLKAIGIVATIIVFGSAMLVKEGWALLGVLERS
jgi:hypothetical protein